MPGRLSSAPAARACGVLDAVVVAARSRKATNVIKQYMQPHRRPRQSVIQAAREEGMNVTNEGGGDFRLDFTMALDGYTSFEHSLPLASSRPRTSVGESELLSLAQKVLTMLF